MIKIHEHLNRPDADQFLDDLALRVWNHFNKKLADGSDYKYYSLVKRLDRLILETDELDYLSDYANNDQDLLNRQKEFFNYLRFDNYAKLKSLVVSRPEELSILRTEILEIFEEGDLYTKNGGVKQTAFGEYLINQLFLYTNFRKSSLSHELVTEMNLQNSFCPYCNYYRIQVVDISDEDSEVELTRAYLDYDHFYPKSQNPYFALSFYNLIPSCHACNSAEKREKEFLISTHTNPYHKSYNENHKFSIDDDWSLKGSTETLTLNKITVSDDFMNRDLKLNQRYRGAYIIQLNELIQNYINYQHYAGINGYNDNYIKTVVQRVPINCNEILEKEAGKMFRDVLKEIDIYDLLD